MYTEESMWIILVVIAFFNWPWASRSIRSQILTLKERNFVKIAKISGVRSTKIAFVEVLPRVLSYVFLVFAIMVAIAIQSEAGIALIGLGQQDFISLGSLLYDYMIAGAPQHHYYHWFIPPGLFLVLFVLLIYVAHASFTKTFNPRARENL